MSRFALVVIACLSLFAGCGDSTAPARSVHEVPGGTAERVAAISAIIGWKKAPPTVILDAHFVEEKIGDGFLGPSDFNAFYVIEVAPGDIPKWTQMLEPLEERVNYVAPTQPRDWWVDPDTFATLQFYASDTLTIRIHGWIGVSRQTGRIYFHTFTT